MMSLKAELDALNAFLSEREAQGALAGPVTLRDQFAIAALSGMLHDGFQPDQCSKQPHSEPYNYAKAAYEIADAMMRERQM